MYLLKKYLAMHLKTELQYKVSFMLTCIAQFLTASIEVFVIYSLFEKFNLLANYNFYEVLISFSIVYLGYSVAETFCRGFDHFKTLIIYGNFDLLLIRPRNIFLQIIGSNIAYEKLSRVVSAIIVLIYGILNANINLTIFNIVIMLLMIIGSIFIFSSIFIIGASFCFITVQGLEVINIFTDGTRQFGQYPMGIYRREILYFFTFIIPLACINYYPLMYILNKSQNLFYAITPIFGIIFILPAIMIFNKGLKRYKSSGS